MDKIKNTKDLKQKLDDLGYEVVCLPLEDGDTVFGLYDRMANYSFVCSFTVDKDLIYNFKYLGSFEELKKLMEVLEEYQHEQEKI